MKPLTVLLALLGVGALAGLYVGLHPEPAGRYVPTAATSPAAPARPAGRSADATTAATNLDHDAVEFELVVRGRELVVGARTLSVRQGRNVIIHVTSDAPEELHLHGYDLKVELEPDRRTALAFNADRSGHFEFELERSGTELGALDVLPR